MSCDARRGLACLRQPIRPHPNYVQLGGVVGCGELRSASCTTPSAMAWINRPYPQSDTRLQVGATNCPFNPPDRSAAKTWVARRFLPCFVAALITKSYFSVPIGVPSANLNANVATPVPSELTV